MATIPSDSLQSARSSTPTSSVRVLSMFPRSATPRRSPVFNPQTAFPATKGVSEGSQRRSSTPGGFGQRPGTPQRSLRMDQAVSAQRHIAALRNGLPEDFPGLTSQPGLPHRRMGVTPSRGLHSSEAAKVSLMRRLVADAPQLRSAQASQSSLGSHPSHLFEDVCPTPSHYHPASALQAHGPSGSFSFHSPHDSSHSSPASRSVSPMPTHQHAAASVGVVKSMLTGMESGSVDVEIGVGSKKIPMFTEEKARILREKMREMENYHDTMYHSALASRLA